MDAPQERLINNKGKYPSLKETIRYTWELEINYKEDKDENTITD